MTKRDKYLQRTYGISELEYKLLLAYGYRVCWICQNPPKPGKNLNLDHDHKLAKTTGVRRSIRGLLCFLCNKRLIGRNRREHADLYRRAAQYLESDGAQELLKGNHVQDQKTKDEPKAVTRRHNRTRPDARRSNTTNAAAGPGERHCSANG